MQFTNALFGLYALSLNLGNASPIAQRETAASIVTAEAMGVDVYGPIPDDYVSYENGTYLTDVDTKANAWVRAQIDLPASDGNVKRQGAANIGIGMFAQDNCVGQSAWFDDVQYGFNDIGDNIFYFSVGISYRGLRDNEQLDFSRTSGSDRCGLYLYSAGFETPIGCFNSQAIQCFRLTLH